MVTPSLDPSTLAELKRQLGASETTLSLPHEEADTPLADATVAVPGLIALNVGSGIRLHGKAYYCGASSLAGTVASVDLTREARVQVTRYSF